MRNFIDFEFIERGDKYPIIPISIGIVNQEGEEYYAEFRGVDWSLANPWVLKNVKPYIGKIPSKDKLEIVAETYSFVGENPEFWGYYSSYDWVVLCQMYGTMVDKPKTWPMICYDLKQYMWHLGIEEDTIPIINEEEHHALVDARWNYTVFNYLTDEIESS